MECPAVIGLRTSHLTIESRDRFGVVIKDIGRRCDQLFDRTVLADEIGREHFDGGLGRGPHCGHTGGEVRGAAIR